MLGISRMAAQLVALLRSAQFQRVSFLFIGTYILNILAQAIILLTCIWQVPILNSCWDTVHPNSRYFFVVIRFGKLFTII
jgi:hypothetical protein